MECTAVSHLKPGGGNHRWFKRSIGRKRNSTGEKNNNILVIIMNIIVSLRGEAVWDFLMCCLKFVLRSVLNIKDGYEDVEDVGI
jgi:hypothetical protein